MIVGELVILRSPIQTDEEFLYQVRNNFAMQKLLLALPRANSMQRVKDWFEQVMDDTQSIFFVAALPEINQPVGFIQIRQMNFIHGTGALGIFIDASAQGKGIASEMISLFENYVRGTFNLRKITLEVLADNLRAVRFYEKLNFIKVGILTKHFYNEGEYHNVLIMEKILIDKSER